MRKAVRARSEAIFEALSTSSGEDSIKFNSSPLYSQATFQSLVFDKPQQHWLPAFSTNDQFSARRHGRFVPLAAGRGRGSLNSDGSIRLHVRSRGLRGRNGSARSG